MKNKAKCSNKSVIFKIIIAVLLVIYIGFVVYINRTMTVYVNLEELREDDSVSLIACDIPALMADLRTVASLPSPDNVGVRDLRFLDLSNVDLSGSAAELTMASFSSETIWPKSIPDSFSADHIMEMGMNPGLGVRELHERGITGEGVGIAVIDFNLLASHEQYANRLRVYELYHTVNQTAVMHSAVASIAAGRDTGVAPGAELYYIATMYGTFLPPFTLTNYSNLVTCIDRILEINTRLSETKKIRVISISRSFTEHELGGADLKHAIDRANEAGVFVITCSPDKNFNFQFSGLGRDPEADPDELSSYTTSLLDTGVNSFTSNTLLLPIDSRTTAGYTGDTDYIFYRRGGYSWGAPWLAGMYALCVQVYPDITPELFITLTLETGDDLCGGRIINPTQLIEKLENGEYVQKGEHVG